MAYENMVSCRLTEGDRAVLDAAIARSGMSQSRYIRSLLRVPLDARRQQVVYVVDGKTLAKTALELTRWGRHYNQAVHALNTVALFICRNSPPEPSELSEELGRVQLMLEEVEQGRRDVEYVLCEIAGSITVGGD